MKSSSKIKDATSLLLASSLVGFILLDACDNLAKHDTAVAIHECHTRETLTILEGVADKRLMRLEGHLSHLIRLYRERIFHLLANSLLTHLPFQGRNTAGGTTTSHETNRRVTDLDLIRDVKDLDLRIKLLSLTKSLVGFVDHHITTTRHVLLVETLDVEADVVTRLGLFSTLMVHLNGEHPM